MSTYQIPQVNDKAPELVDSAFYTDIRFDPDDVTPTYIGLNVKNAAATSSNDWKVFKFTAGGAGNVRIQVAYGSWDNRAILSW